MGQIAALLRLMARPGLAGGCDLVPVYERAVAAALLGDGDRPTLAFWRGRVALWTLLKALPAGPDDEVILPAYTCEMVPAAARFAGVAIRYADVAGGDVNVSPATLSPVMSARTAAIVCQHTYGCELPMAAIAAISPRAAILEDRCQLICDPAAAPAASGVAAFYSTQWSKPFSTGLGGLATFEDPELYRRCREIRESFDSAGHRKRARSLAVQMLLYSLTVRPWTRHAIAAAYRRAQRWGLVKGTTGAGEYEDCMPVDYLAQGLNIQAVLGQAALGQWTQNIGHRRRLTELYVGELGSRTVRPNADGRPLWALPVWVDNKADVLEQASRARLPVETWFGRLPVHIDPRTAGRYGYTPGQCPRAEKLFEREVHLSTGPDVSVERARAAAAMLKRVGRFTTL